MNKKAEISLVFIVLLIIIIFVIGFSVFSFVTSYHISKNQCLMKIGKDFCEDIGQEEYTYPSYNFYLERYYFYCRDIRGVKYTQFRFTKEEIEKCES